MRHPDAFRYAAEQYEQAGVNVESALARLAAVSISMQCWQGDDVGGFEKSECELGGGLAVTGNYPGKARTADELRSDARQAFRLIPGRHRFNLHACYAEADGVRVERSELAPVHFQNWIEWARELNLGLDFNPTFFAHTLASSGMTLAHSDSRIRDYWIAHGIATRRVAAAFGRGLNNPAVHNIWIPDGSKDLPADRLGPRLRLQESLDRVLEETFPATELIDAVEAKLFGIGSEAYVVGSHEFYFGYAVRKQIAVCLDSGHFHPTESIADKISATLLSVPNLLLHVSRGIRWDSDHVVILDDELLALMREIVRAGFLDRVRIGLDYFDASINRIAAWVIGMRATQKALLVALLEPIENLRTAEQAGDLTRRLAIHESTKALPWAIVWNEFCYRNNVPLDSNWLPALREYEKSVTSLRG